MYRCWNLCVGVLFGVFFLFSFSAQSIAAPLTEKEIPQYPGAVLDPAGDPDMLPPAAPDGPQAVVKLYRVQAAADEVFKFYKLKLEATSDSNKDGSSDALKVGAASPVLYSMQFMDLDPFIDDEGTVVCSTEQKKKLLSSCRSPLEAGHWVDGAQFSWDKKEISGGVTNFLVNIADDGVSPRWKTCAKKTKIAVSVTRTASSDAVDQENDAKLAQKVAEKSKALNAHPPSEKEVGVPAYPGSRFDAKSSAGMSAGGSIMYIFLSDDVPSKIVQFYEVKLKKKARPMPEGSFLFALKGDFPLPLEGMTIQPNTMLPDKAKSVITVLKQEH